MVWGLRNMSLLILNKKKNLILFLDGFWLFLGPPSPFRGKGVSYQAREEGMDKRLWGLSPVFIFFPILPVIWFRGRQVGFEKGQDLRAVVG